MTEMVAARDVHGHPTAHLPDRGGVPQGDDQEGRRRDSTRPVKITDPRFGEHLDLFDDLPEPEHPRDRLDSAVD